ncbi:Putative F-box/FBD/LRR-repeat protein At4g00315 [Linum grandiflorum]
MKNSKEENDSSIDRLSNLPEAVIHHILSFLDTKSAVQTSVLSRQWKSSWKYLAVLEFDGYGMWQHEFERFNSDNSDLKTLELSGLSFDSRFRWSSFRALEKLDMFGCTFSAGEDEVIIDPFRNLPCLKHLKLSPYNKCSNDDTIFRISGPQLLSLRVSYNDFRKMAIHAPKLKDLTIQYDYTNCHVEFTELNLPSVDHANVLVRFLDDVYNEGEHNECIKQQIIPLFVGLKNATSLGLSSFTARLLGDISDYLEEQPSPFTRLKSLILESMRDGVPFAVVNHLLKGSSAMKPVVKFTSQL